MSRVWTLGINWNFHDTSAALVDGNGVVWAMSEEERFTRVKHAFGSFPVQATKFCLDRAGITWLDLDVVAVGWDMDLYAPWGEEDASRLFAELFERQLPRSEWPELVFVDHHLAHATVSFHGSGFENAGVLVTDGSGERASISIFSASRDGGLRLHRDWPRTSSLGSLYEAATRALGFRPLEGGKVMGLAPYGTDPVTDLVSVANLLEGRVEGPPGFASDADLEDEECVVTWLAYFEERFGTVTRGVADLPTDPVACVIAAGAQFAVEQAVVALHAETVELTGHESVCLSGGVALNCVANGLLPEPLFVPPVPHDAGVALGAAWSVSPPAKPALLSPYLGSDVRMGVGDPFDAVSVEPFEPADVVDMLLRGSIGALAEGRAEIGPRALGHRSIIAVPRPACVLTAINDRKGRERWRPLAPVARRGASTGLWPELGSRSTYMTGSALVGERAHADMPAAVHVDGSTRAQNVDPKTAPALESILDGLHAAGVPPVLINTSFNRRGEPIVNNGRDAILAFLRLGLDFLVLDGHVCTRRPG